VLPFFGSIRARLVWLVSISKCLDAEVETRFFLRIQMSLQRGINLRALAEKMGQCSGAEVRGICTEAGSYLPSEGNIPPRDKIILQGCMRYASGDNMLHRKTLNLLLPRFV